MIITFALFNNSKLLMYTPANYSVSPTKGAMSVGAVAAGVMLLVGILGLSILGWFIFIGCIFVGMRAYRKVLGGTATYSNALNVGFQTAFFASLILAFFAYMSTTFDSSLIPAMLDAVEERLKTSGMQPGFVEFVVQGWRETLSPMLYGGILVFMYSAVGGFISVILAFFVANAKHEEYVEN